MMLTLNILAALIALSAIDWPVRGFEARHQDNVVLVQRGDGSSTRGSSARGNSGRGTTMSADRPRRNADGVDCHRDVRTHRIRGEWVRHRHVGEDCAVRVVRQAESVLPD